jgi:hypothetical protein
MKNLLNIKTILSALFIAGFVFTLASCSEDEEVAKELTLDKTTVTVKAGETATVAITSGNGAYTLSNTSTETATAELTGTTITVSGKKAGETTLTIEDKSGKKATVKITVNPADYVPTSAEFSWNGNKIELEKANNWGTTIFASLVAVTNVSTKEQSVLSWTGGLTVGDKSNGKLEVVGGSTVTLTSIKVVTATSNTYYITFEGDSKKGWIYFTK